MYSMSVLCPLCAQTSFSSIDALRCSLIKAANGPLACPICHELFLGLDKLTIHLFSHTNIMNSANNADTTIATAATPTTPTPHNPNTTNIEKLKINKHCENLNNINNNNKKCNEDTNEIIQTHVNNNEGNFVNTHQEQQQQLWEKNMITKASPPDKTTIVNKLNSTQQHQQVSTEPGESRELENVAQCDICEFTFRNEELRNMHIRLVHQNSNDNFSNKPLTTTTALAANDCKNSSNMDHDFKCHLCPKTFKTKGSLRVHLKVVHLMGLPYGNNAQKITICDRIRHNDNKMPKSANPSNNDNENVNTNSIANIPSTSATKNNCNLFNITPVNFLSHLNAIPANTSNVSVLNLNQPLEFRSDNLNDNSSALQASANVLLVLNTNGTTEMPSDTSSISNNLTIKPSTSANDSNVAQQLIYSMANVTENPKIWECDVCSKAFTTKYFLKKHKRLHTGEMPYTCELCARTFTFQQSYHKHLLYHSDEKPHVCSTCGRAFKELSTLHNHERIHSGEKPFKCEVCGKSFRQRVSFLVHTRIHTGVMPYKCELCQRSFRYKVSQRTHKCQTSPTNDENGIDNVSENFIKAFLETSAGNEADQQHLNQSQHSPASNEIAAINEKAASLNEQEALLAKSIDDIVVESCNKMGIGSDIFATEQIKNEGCISPSQKLQNMRLYSPQMITPDLNGDLTRFFLENSTSGNNLF